MNYDPQTQYRGDQYIFAGGQNMARIAEQLAGYFIDRGNRTKAARAQAEALLGPDDQAGPATNSMGTPSPTFAPAGSEGDMGGFNPTTGGPSPASPDDNNEPSPAAQRGTQADALRKLIQAYAPGQKDMHQAIKGMSVDQLEGMLKGYAMKQAAAEHAAKMSDFEAQAQLRRQQALDDQTVGRLIRAYGQGPDVGQGPVSADERMRYAFTQVPDAAGGRVLPKAIEALTRYEQLRNPKAGEDLTPQFTEDPVTGLRFYRSGKTSIASGVNPAVAPKPEPYGIHDAQGNLLQWALPNGKGGWTYKDVSQAQLVQARDENGNPIKGFYVGPGKKVVDARTQMDKAGLEQLLAGTGAGGKGTSTTAPAGGAEQMPSAKKDLVKGKRYMLPGRTGAWTWDGTQFMPPQ
jgi:hypothetical protein